MPDKLFDVVIYERATLKVDTIAGEAMKRFAGYYNAHERLQGVLYDIDDRYGARVVPAGKYKVGDVLDDE